MAKNQRRKQLIQPRLQLKLTLSFLGVAAIALLLQFILFTSTLTEIAAWMPDDGSGLFEYASTQLVHVLEISFAVLLPLTFCVGVLVTFRFAGPLYRFEQHLKAIVRGENPGPCKIRSGDDLQDLCRLLNEAIDKLRQQGTAPAESHEAAQLPRDIAA